MRRSSAVLVILVVGLGLAALVAHLSDGFDGEELVTMLVAVELVLVGSILILRVPENRVSWVLFTLAASGVLVSAIESWIPGIAEPVAGVWLFVVLLPGFAVFLPLWFPTGEPPSPAWRWVGWLYLPALAAILVGNLYATTVEGLGQDYECVSPGSCVAVGGLAILLVMAVAAVLSFVIRWIRSGDLERHQLRWLVLPFLFFALGVVTEFGIAQDSLIADLFGALGAVLIPIAILIAITRYRLYEIDRIISRTISYSIVVGLLAGAVALLAAIVGTQFENPLVVAATTLGVAAAFNPLRRGVQSWVDRRFNRSRYDAELVMDGFAGSLRERMDGDEVVEGWVGVVSETMQPTSVGVWLRE